MVGENKNIPELRFQGFSGAWEKRKLNQLGKVSTGNTPSTSNTDNWVSDNTGHVWITPTDISEVNTSDSGRHLSDHGWTKARTVKANSVLITSIASIGKNTINTVPAAFNQQINAIEPIDNDAEFVLSAMTKETKRFAALAGQTATAIINKTEFEKFSLSVPSLAEQVKIGSFFKSLDNLIAVNQRKLDALKKLKQGYLKKMFC